MKCDKCGKQVWSIFINTKYEKLCDVCFNKEKIGETMKFEKYITETGEMGKHDIEKGGDWYDARLELEKVAKKAKLKGEVRPFDQYQGPYFTGGGVKIWLSENPGIYYLVTPSEAFEFDAEEIAAYFKKRMAKKPKVKVKK